jgi:hypothetical protein
MLILQVEFQVSNKIFQKRACNFFFGNYGCPTFLIADVCEKFRTGCVSKEHFVLGRFAPGTFFEKFSDESSLERFTRVPSLAL